MLSLDFAANEMQADFSFPLKCIQLRSSWMVFVQLHFLLQRAAFKARIAFQRFFILALYKSWENTGLLRYTINCLAQKPSELFEKSFALSISWEYDLFKNVFDLQRD